MDHLTNYKAFNLPLFLPNNRRSLHFLATDQLTKSSVWELQIVIHTWLVNKSSSTTLPRWEVVSGWSIGRSCKFNNIPPSRGITFSHASFRMYAGLSVGCGVHCRVAIDNNGPHEKLLTELRVRLQSAWSLHSSKCTRIQAEVFVACPRVRGQSMSLYGRCIRWSKISRPTSRLM